MVGTVGIFGTGVDCELVFWSATGSGVIRVVGTVGMFGTSVDCELVFWPSTGSEVIWEVETFRAFEEIIRSLPFFPFRRGRWRGILLVAQTLVPGGEIFQFFGGPRVESFRRRGNEEERVVVPSRGAAVPR